MTAVMIFPAYAQQKEDNPGQITNGKRTYEIMPELTGIDAQPSVKSLNGQKNPVGNIGSLNIYKKTDVPPTDTDSISGGLTASGADSVRPNKIKPHFVVKNTQTGAYGVSYGDIQIHMHDGQSIQYVLKEYPVSLSYGFQGNTSFAGTYGSAQDEYADILARIDSYRTVDPVGTVIIGTMNSAGYPVKNLTLYIRTDGSFLKIKDARRYYYGLRSHGRGVLYISSVDQRWTNNPLPLDPADVNIGDLLIPTYSHDYNIIKIETNLDVNERIITLAPKNLDVPYGKIRLRVNGQLMPLSAELYSVSGELKYNVEYKKYRKFDGSIKLSRAEFTHSIYRNDPVTVEFNEYRKTEIKGDFFSPNNLALFNNIE
ncbi:hypothetical protein CHS0354_026778 [Potamilus streckersoni]|uniref:Uncharacterized protein TP-0789 domain-containing protein n=1 Tax=Potamilus streckersoni TaxID=2493646 RepID=A0AAE0T6B4_9BIVA|nr:hypothetical protein CHS0354_026778 [Potamilus streckersoni]